MSNVRLVTVAAALFVVGELAAQQFFNWNSFDAGLRLRPRLELVLHHRGRFSESNGVDQQRAGGILRYALSPRWVTYGGYYFQPQHTADDRWIRGHRVFSGIETSGPLKRQWSWTGRVALERFLATGRPDYNRYRSYLRLIYGAGKVAPYLQNETIAVRYGFHSMRSGGGLRFRTSPTISFEVGCLYDLRQTEWGGDRVALVSGFRWNQRGR